MWNSTEKQELVVTIMLIEATCTSSNYQMAAWNDENPAINHKIYHTRFMPDMFS